ncbi:hypothetical protein STRDD11_01908 [Streptococcus sp. DD11]|nr:hypothetical protein STRDD11_01908 [Streptococcus sp. DD11]
MPYPSTACGWPLPDLLLIFMEQPLYYHALHGKDLKWLLLNGSRDKPVFAF